METPKGKKFCEMTKEELSACGKAGAKKTNEIIKRKKSMQTILDFLLSMPLKNGSKCYGVEEIKAFANLQGKNLTVQEAMMIKQIQRALKGDLNSAQFIRDTSGQKPVEDVKVSGAIPVVIKEDINE